MNLTELVSVSMAQAQGAGQQNILFTFGPIILIFVVMYFLMIRPQQKRQKEHKKMIEALAKGDEIVTNGGLLGKVTKVTESYIHVDISAGESQTTEALFQRSAVLAVLPKNTLKSL